MTPAELAAYFERIGYSGPRTPDPVTLAGIMHAHARAIPFENLDVLLGRPIRTEPASLLQKLVHARRGGYCFEQNHLLLYVLRALGFAADPMIARVRWQVPADVATPLTHMLVRVSLDHQPWLADVGMGSLSLTAPLLMADGLEQDTPHDRRRLVRQGAHFAHQVLFDGAWQDVSHFLPEIAAAPDLELGNWYSHTHPQAHFRNNLMVARATDGGRLTLYNREFTRRDRSGGTMKRELATPDDLHAVLAEEFGLAFPAGTRFEAPGLVWP